MRQKDSACIPWVELTSTKDQHPVTDVSIESIGRDRIPDNILRLSLILNLQWCGRANTVLLYLENRLVLQ
jgi:hypothetical protein